MNKLTPATLVFGIGAIVTFIASFLDFVGDGPFGFNAWSMDYLAFATTAPAILALVGIVWTILEIAGVKLPDDVLTFNAKQLRATWGIGAAGIMLSWITVDNITTGYWLMFLGSIAMAVGAILSLLGVADQPLSSGQNTPTAPAGYPPQAPPVPPAPGMPPSAPPAAPPAPPAPPAPGGGTPPPPPPPA